ncbi:MAG TPA: hypothetical protein VI139_06615 [Gemmatimonadales bacterium]
MLYDLRHADARLRWLVTCLLATFGLAYCFGAWMVGRYAGFGPRQVAETYAGPPMHMAMPPDTTVVVEHPLTMGQMAAEDHHVVAVDLLIQDTHVHVPMYGVIAAVLSLVVLGLSLPRSAGFALITLLFAAPWLDFAGMWLVKLVSPAFAILTVAGGWAMGAGYTIVAVIAVRQMWFSRKGAA